MLVKDRLIVIIILADGGTFGRRAEQSAENKKPGKAINIEPDLCKPLVGRAKGI